jgi:hypothetical protein
MGYRGIRRRGVGGILRPRPPDRTAPRSVRIRYLPHPALPALRRSAFPPPAHSGPAGSASSPAPRRRGTRRGRHAVAGSTTVRSTFTFTAPRSSGPVDRLSLAASKRRLKTVSANLPEETLRPLRTFTLPAVTRSASIHLRHFRALTFLAAVQSRLPVLYR